MLRVLSRTSTKEAPTQSNSAEAGQRSRSHDDPNPADISRVLTPDEDPFAKAEVVAVEFADPFAPSGSASAASRAMGRAQSPVMQRARERTARPLHLRVDVSADSLYRPSAELLSPPSSALTTLTFAPNEACTPTSATHDALGLPITPTYSSLPMLSHPSPSFAFPARSSPKKAHMSPRSHKVRNKNLPLAPHELASRDQTAAARVSVRGPLFIPPTPPRRGSAPLVAVAGFPVPSPRLNVRKPKESARSAARIWPAGAGLGASSLAPPAVDDGRKPRFRERLGSAFKFGKGVLSKSPAPLVGSSTSPLRGPHEEGQRAKDSEVARDVAHMSTLFPFVNHSGYVTPIGSSPSASARDNTPMAPAYVAEAICPPVHSPSPSVGDSVGETPVRFSGANGTRALCPPPQDARRSRSLSPLPSPQASTTAVPDDTLLRLTSRPTSGASVTAFGPAASTAPLPGSMLEKLPRKDQLRLTPEELACAARKGSFPFEVALQRSLGELDLMFTPRTQARESFMALDDADDVDGDEWLFGEREPWERASERTSLVSEQSMLDMGSDASDEASGGEGERETVAEDAVRERFVPEDSWRTDPNGSIISATASSLGLVFTDPWFSMRTRPIEEDGCTIASSEGTEESVERWPMPPKRSIVVGEDGTAWLDIETNPEVSAGRPFPDRGSDADGDFF